MDQQDRLAARVHPAGAVVPSPTATLWTVQVLRGVAALMVVIGHSQSAVAAVVVANGGVFARSTLVPWGAGVDLFFVISGFIMVHASARLFGRAGARAEFLRRRLVRIVPLYWAVTTMFLALLALATMKGGDRFPSAGAVLASYLFIPVDTYGDGRLFPVLDLGWTLNYEMFFYAILALVIGWRRKAALTAIGLLLAACVGLGLGMSGASPAWFWTRPIILDFGLGVAVGALVAQGTILPIPIRALLAVLGVGVLLADPTHLFNGATGMTVANAWPRVVWAGLPIAAVLAAAVLGGEPRLPRVGLPFTRIGDASYSLYLFHPVALIAMEKLAQKLPAVRGTPGWLLVLVTVAAALAIALAAYRWIERPMTMGFARLLATRPSPPQSVAAAR
ncbi:acyltransferase family protein [Sphingomonas bacterium]|uniref:acyltransferase family protein n=1 Tax=Sphingomonas bacterium TaxID=1895847 RepID=UPI00157563BF|nr:acyltransferase [Sphingomonas bacterium]